VLVELVDGVVIVDVDVGVELEAAEGVQIV
jgi:hypothetical protein